MASSDSPAGPYAATQGVPPHLADWQLPPGWRWGGEGVRGEYRYFQEVVDALGRSLSLVSAPDPAHAEWLFNEARHLAHRGHPNIPTTYHYWTAFREAGRGPGYLRRWIGGQTVAAQVANDGPIEIPQVITLLREVGSTVAYLHDTGSVHGALSPSTVWITPARRIWLLGWQWAVARDEVPAGLAPDFGGMPAPPEWTEEWAPTAQSDQWLLAAVAFNAITGEPPPARDVPPVRWVRPETPATLAELIDRGLQENPEDRYASVGSLLRALDRAVGTRTPVVSGADEHVRVAHASEEERLRWALGEEYELLASLGSGTFGSVWRVRDLSLEREAALKMLHPHIARDQRAVARFRREARLAAQLAHPAIVPIYDWDGRGDVEWYTMELAENGSLADLVKNQGRRSVHELAPQVEPLLDGLAAAHAYGIIHRDLKPENILIDRYGRWRITDFGIANIAGEETGSGTGTPSFCAPEQLLREPLTPATDCFAVAAVLLFALSGNLPFGGGDARAILAQQLAGTVDLSASPPPLADWLRRALAPEPELRFAEAGEMLAAWRSAAAELSADEERQGGWWRLFRRESATHRQL